MKQTLQIFVKDLRHYWREGAACIALLVAYGWDEVRGWPRWTLYGDGAIGVGAGALFSLPVLLGFVVVLLPLAWALLVVRVIQAESLVGDRQFWITRPYEWKKLLAAKVLFVVVFLNVPWLIAEAFLLAKAGFSPMHYLTGLLWLQLLMTIALVLPVAALATVTRTVAQILLALLGIVLFLIGASWLSSQIPSSNFSGPADSLSLGLLIGTCVAIILLQYARRRIDASRIVIVAAALAFLLILIATPYRAIVAREFPPLDAREQLPFQMTLLPGETSQGEAPSQNGKEVSMRLPMLVSGLAADAIVVIDGFIVEIEPSDGPSWNSGWISPGLFIFPNTKNTQFDFSLKKKVFQRMQLHPAKARISLAFTLFRDANQRSFVVPSSEFLMQGVGRCFPGAGYSRSIHCFMPLRRPRSLMITSDLSENTCPLYEGESLARPGEIARDWTTNSDSEPAEFGLSPVKRIELALLYRSPGRIGGGLCPGTPTILSNPQPVRRNQSAIEVDNLRLSDYQLAPLRFTTGNVAAH